MFQNRAEAGRQLANKLILYQPARPLILGLPRGGVPVAFEVAEKLGAPLDTLVVRKIGAPFNPEFGIGAIAPGDVIVLENNVIQDLGLSQTSVDRIIEQEMREMERRIELYRSGEYSRDFVTDTAILIDDGLATGVTARAALESAKLVYVGARIIFAAPVGAVETVEYLRRSMEVICLEEIENLGAIGNWYQEFSQTTDQEVIALLGQSQVNRYG